MTPLVSVIVPILAADRDAARQLIARIPVDLQVETVVAEAGTELGLESLSQGRPDVTVVHTQQGRGRQMNAAAGLARGEWLLFLHADSQLPSDWLDLFEASVRRTWNRIGPRAPGPGARRHRRWLVSVRPGRPGLAGTADRARSGVAGSSAAAAVWRSGALRPAAHVCGSGRLSRHRVDGRRGLRPPHDEGGSRGRTAARSHHVGATMAARWLVPPQYAERHAACSVLLRRTTAGIGEVVLVLGPQSVSPQ